MISAKLLVEIGSRSTKLRLRRHFSTPQKSKIRVEKGRFARDKMRIYQNIFYTFTDNLIQRVTNEGENGH